MNTPIFSKLKVLVGVGTHNLVQGVERKISKMCTCGESVWTFSLKASLLGDITIEDVSSRVFQTLVLLVVVMGKMEERW